MPETREAGIWWLPDAEDRQVAGTLIVSDSDIPRLELIGMFRGLEHFGKDFSPPVILGLASGKLVTLYRCLSTGGTFQAPGFASERYAAHFVLRGAHLPRPEDITFSSMSVEYDGLFEWVGITGIQSEQHTDAEGRFTGLDVRFAFPDTPTFSIDGATLSVNLRAGLDGSHRSPAIAVKQYVSFSVKSVVPLQLEEFLERYLHDLSNFVTLGVGAPVRTTAIAGVLPPASTDPREHESRVEILFRGRDHHVTDVKRRWDMLFTLPDLGPFAEQAFRRWFQRASELRAIYDLYFGTLFQERAYLHQRFLMLAQALESYHRCTVSGTLAPSDLFAPLLASLRSVVEESRPIIGRDATEAFLGKLTYLNEVSLRRRLRELYATHKPIASQMIRNGPRFVTRVLDTRNYHTHYDSAAESSAVSGADLLLLSEQMRFLLELCLMSELGLPSETVDALVKRHQRYAGLTSRLQAFDPAT